MFAGKEKKTNKNKKKKTSNKQKQSIKKHYKEKRSTGNKILTHKTNKQETRRDSLRKMKLSEAPFRTQDSKRKASNKKKKNAIHIPHYSRINKQQPNQQQQKVK